MTPKERTEHHFGPFWERDFGAITILYQTSLKFFFDLSTGLVFPVGIPWTCYRGHLGLSGPKLQIESENEFPCPFGCGAPKVQNGVEKMSK